MSLKFSSILKQVLNSFQWHSRLLLNTFSIDRSFSVRGDNVGRELFIRIFSFSVMVFVLFRIGSTLDKNYIIVPEIHGIQSPLRIAIAAYLSSSIYALTFYCIGFFRKRWYASLLQWVAFYTVIMMNLGFMVILYKAIYLVSAIAIGLGYEVAIIPGVIARFAYDTVIPLVWTLSLITNMSRFLEISKWKSFGLLFVVFSVSIALLISIAPRVNSLINENPQVMNYVENLLGIVDKIISILEVLI